MYKSGVCVVAASLLVACGGGGGGSSEPLAQSATPLTITESNYVGVTQSVLEGTNDLNSLSSGSLSVLSGVQLDAQPVWLPAVVSQVKNIKNIQVPNGVHLVGVESGIPERCDISGTFTSTLTDQNGDGKPNAGDNVAITFNNCVNSDGTINGSLSAVIHTFVDGVANANNEFELSINLNNFSVVSGGSSTFASGDLRLKWVDSNNVETLNLSASKISSSSTVAGVTKRFGLSGFTATLIDGVNGDSQTYAGNLSMSAYENKRVSIETTETWLFQDGAEYPYRGQMVLTGQAGSKVRLTAQLFTAASAPTVLLELDANGDGTYEKSETRTWSSLQ